MACLDLVWRCSWFSLTRPFLGLTDVTGYGENYGSAAGYARLPLTLIWSTVVCTPCWDSMKTIAKYTFGYYVCMYHTACTHVVSHHQPLFLATHLLPWPPDYCGFAKYDRTKDKLSMNTSVDCRLAHRYY